jgi:hypothetical protein
MSFSEGKLFHDKRSKLIVDERLPSILFAGSLDTIIEWKLLNDKTRNLTV